MKKIFSFVLCVALMLPLALTTPSVPEEIYDIDTSNVDPNFSYNSSWDADFVRDLENAFPNTIVEHDGETGETTIFESSAQPYSNTTETEPYIPDGVDVSYSSSISPSSVIGSDSRTNVTDVSSYPYCTSAFLEITREDGATSSATGFFVSNRIILTAGHCVHNKDHGWATSITVTPGGVNSSFSSSITTRVGTNAKWLSNHDREYDYGVIILDSPMGTGYLGLSAKTDSDLSKQKMVTYGYPGDKDDGTLWCDLGTIQRVATREIFYDADTEAGQSGGVVTLNSDAKHAIAIHTNGTGLFKLFNSGTRINSDIIKYVNDWKAEIGD